MPQAKHGTPAYSNLVPRARPERKTDSRYAVLEAGFNGERVIFETDDRAAANRVKEQHAARRVVEG